MFITQAPRLVPSDFGKFVCDVESIQNCDFKPHLTMKLQSQYRTRRQCDQICQNFAILAKNIKNGKFFMYYLSICKNFEPTLAKVLCYWATFHCFKWPKIQIGSLCTDLRRFLNWKLSDAYLPLRRGDLKTVKCTSNWTPGQAVAAILNRKNVFSLSLSFSLISDAKVCPLCSPFTSMKEVWTQHKCRVF